ncbi:MAG: hypothetical protein Tsb0015_10530 [Simkaniaceae bacterium]
MITLQNLMDFKINLEGKQQVFLSTSLKCHGRRWAMFHIWDIKKEKVAEKIFTFTKNFFDNHPTLTQEEKSEWKIIKQNIQDFKQKIQNKKTPYSNSSQYTKIRLDEIIWIIDQRLTPTQQMKDADGFETPAPSYESYSPFSSPEFTKQQPSVSVMDLRPAASPIPDKKSDHTPPYEDFSSFSDSNIAPPESPKSTRSEESGSKCDVLEEQEDLIPDISPDISKEVFHPKTFTFNFVNNLEKVTFQYFDGNYCDVELEEEDWIVEKVFYDVKKNTSCHICPSIPMSEYKIKIILQTKEEEEIHILSFSKKDLKTDSLAFDIP